MLVYHIAEEFHSPSSEFLHYRISRDRFPITVYWDPDIKTSNSTSEFSIPLKKTENKIVILLEGTDQQGKPGFAYAVLQ